MFFISNKAKQKTEEQRRIIKNATALADAQHLKNKQTRLAAICGELENVGLLSRLEEALECYGVILDNTHLHDLKCGSLISNNWVLRRKANKTITLEYTGE
jgi:hypothetical protein